MFEVEWFLVIVVVIDFIKVNFVCFEDEVFVVWCIGGLVVYFDFEILL